MAKPDSVGLHLARDVCGGKRWRAFGFRESIAERRADVVSMDTTTSSHRGRNFYHVLSEYKVLNVSKQD